MNLFNTKRLQVEWIKLRQPTIVILTLILFYSSSFAAVLPQSDTTCKALITGASTSGDIREFFRFVNCLEKKDSRQRRAVLSNDTIQAAIHHFDQQLFSRRWDDTLFAAHLAVLDLISANVEASEGADSKFSSEFNAHVPASLLALDKIKDDRLIKRIVRSVAFEESNAYKIVDYLKTHHQTKKRYYKFFLEQTGK
jgi:hypothetical protein